jgi:hypothetical protein
LRSDSFVVREQAMSALYDMGAPALGLMRQKLADGMDPESTHRLGEVIRRLAENDIETRLDQFLAGEDVSLEGWTWAAGRLGDNQVIRDTFVSMTRQFPEAIALLDADSRSRGKALSLMIDKIKPSLVFGGSNPSPVAAIALLLPITDAEVPVSKELDEIMLLLFRRVEHQKLLENKSLSEPYKDLINRWAMRSMPVYRAQVMQQALSLELSCALGLATETLDLVSRLRSETLPRVEVRDDAQSDTQSPESKETNDQETNDQETNDNPLKDETPADKVPTDEPSTLLPLDVADREPLKPSERIIAKQLDQPLTIGFALQGLARRGSKDQLEFAVPFLEDTRAATSDLMQQIEFKTIRIRTEIGDVAAATIATMMGIDLNELGFKRAIPGARDGFSFGEVGFMADEDRVAVKARIIRLIRDPDLKLRPLSD